jgi:hypothetical protein
MAADQPSQWPDRSNDDGGVEYGDDMAKIATKDAMIDASYASLSIVWARSKSFWVIPPESWVLSVIVTLL